MALKIRLTRQGAKKRPFYRIVVADVRSPRDGRFIARVGSYNPMLKKDDAARVVLDLELCKEWLAKGAQPTDRVLRFFDQAGLMKREKRNNPEKAIARKDRGAAEEAAAAAAAAPKPAPAAPAPVAEAAPAATEDAAS